ASTRVRFPPGGDAYIRALGPPGRVPPCCRNSGKSSACWFERVWRRPQLGRPHTPFFRTRPEPPPELLRAFGPDFAFSFAYRPSASSAVAGPRRQGLVSR